MEFQGPGTLSHLPLISQKEKGKKKSQNNKKSHKTFENSLANFSSVIRRRFFFSIFFYIVMFVMNNNNNDSSRIIRSWNLSLDFSNFFKFYGFNDITWNHFLGLIVTWILITYQKIMRHFYSSWKNAMGWLLIVLSLWGIVHK